MTILQVCMAFVTVISFGSGTIFFSGWMATISIEHVKLKRDIRYVCGVGLTVSMLAFLVSYFIGQVIFL